MVTRLVNKIVYNSYPIEIVWFFSFAFKMKKDVIVFNKATTNLACKEKYVTIENIAKVMNLIFERCCEEWTCTCNRVSLYCLKT